MISHDNRRIAKNTLMLYIRMFLTMGISLFTTRIVLDALGVTDYGIYNVVGGIVAMFGVFSKTLANATQRFLNFSLGKNILNETRKTFSMSIIIHSLLALTILLLGETIGLWFLIHKMNIPVDRMNAAQRVYQFSVFASVISILQIPFTAIIIANEKMKVYAFLSIFEAVLKLAVAYILLITTFDLLVSYGFLIMIAQFLIFWAFYFISKHSFPECNFSFIWDKKLFETMLSYFGWNTMSGLASVFSKEGVNILLNIFFGPTVNAARGISMQVNNAVRGFASNFQIAVNPQIVKLYASEQRKKMFNLIINNAKYALFLMSLLAVPFMLEIDFVLQLWLKEVPDFTALFCRITLLQSVFMSLHLPLGMGIHAHGKMKIPNLTVSIVYILVLPISYVLLKLGFPEYTPFLIMLIVEPITISIDLFLLKSFISFPVREYLLMAAESILILLAALIIPSLLHFYIDFGWSRFLIVLVTSFLSLTFATYRWGLSDDIKSQITLKLNSILK